MGKNIESRAHGEGGAMASLFSGGTSLRNLFRVHYRAGVDENDDANEVEMGWTPSKDEAMVQADGVEVTAMDYFDAAKDPEADLNCSSSSRQNSSASENKSEKTSNTSTVVSSHVSNQPSKLFLSQRYAMSVATSPKQHLYTTLFVCAILTVGAIVGGIMTGATVAIHTSWLTRGTLISSRSLQVLQLGRVARQQYDSTLMSNRQKVGINDPPPTDEVVRVLDANGTPPINEVVCSGKWYGTSAKQLNLVTVWKTLDDSKNALDGEALYQMCVNEEHVLERLEKNDLCYKCPVGDDSLQERCIKPHSLVTAARFYMQTLSTWSQDLEHDIFLTPSVSCDNLRAAWTEDLQSKFTNALLDCTDSLLEQYDLKGSEGDASTCSFPDANMVATLVDVNFARSGRVEYTSAIYASKHDTDSLNELYQLDKSQAFSQEGDALKGLYEVGFQPLWTDADGGFYLRDLTNAITLDIILALVACAVAGLLFIWHTKSPYLTLFGLVQIILALPISWLLYRFAFGHKSFPVSNLGGIFIVFALGTDDVFVMVDKWKSARSLMTHSTPITDVAIVSIPSAIVATLMTSLTTSVGFFAANASGVATIRLFGTFCGLLVAVDYILSVLILSPVLCLYDNLIMGDQPSRFISIFNKRHLEEEEEEEEGGEEEGTVEQTRDVRDCILRRYVDILNFSRWPALLVSFNAIIACSFVASTFKQPEKLPYPSLLPKSNPYEAHSKFVENLVAFPLQFAKPEWAVQAVFGVQAIDNGNKFDPDPSFPGSVVYDDQFDAANNQKYLMKFCDEIEKPNEDYKCVLEDFDAWLQLQSLSTTPDDEYISNCGGESSIPMQSNIFDKCLIAYSELTKSEAITFDNEAKKVKSIVIDTRVDSTMSSSPTEIDKDWHQIEDWSASERSRAPEGANNFFISSTSFWYVDTYNNIVSSGLKAACIVIACAALVILLSSRSLMLSLFSGISILYVLVASTASLASLGWNFGVFESTLFAILVGLGSDFIIHFAHAYSMLPGRVDKRVRVNHAMLHMGSSVLGSAATTLSTSIIMLFCRIECTIKFATVMIMTIVHSLIGTFLIFSVLCLCFGPAEPTKRFDSIRNRVVNQLEMRERKRVAMMPSDMDVPQSIEIVTDADTSNESSLRHRRRMSLISYVLAFILILCIDIGAYILL